MKKYLFITVMFFSFMAQGEWTFDFSRRSKDVKDYSTQVPQNAKKEESFFESIFDSTVPTQEVVILNTEKGFIPSTLRIKQGMRYKINVVNINETEKNVSFIMDAFSEHHATYYGNVKSFTVTPKKEGVFTYQCPETSAQGKLVVFPGNNQDATLRQPASEE